MNKDDFLKEIIKTLNDDLSVLTIAAKTAHAAATHEECLPDNKYDTTGLEASYVAQGQANRAQEIRQSLDSYRNLQMRSFDEVSPIRLTALVSLEADDGSHRHVFLGPDAGGLKLTYGDLEYIVITPESPLCKALLGKVCDEDVSVGHGKTKKMFTVISVA